MEGLEISEVYLSYAKEISDVFRLDSFYYLKKFINAENIIAKHKTEKLKKISKSILSFGAYSLNNFVEYQDYGIPFIRGVNLKNGMLDFNDMIFINEAAHKLLWKSEVSPNTILLSMSGTIGDVALAMPSFSYPMNSNQDIAKIRIKENVSTYYVYAFLLSRFGQNYLSREARGSVQQHVFLSQMENFVIPILNTDIQNEIDLLVKQSYSDVDSANNLYSQAEDLLINSIGFNDWQPVKKLYNIKQLKESFLQSGRLDAEYYQLKYDDLFEKLSHYRCNTISEIATIKKSIEPGSDSYCDSGVPFVRVSDITKFGISEPTIYLSRSDYDVSELHPKKDTILLSKDGSVGIAYKVAEDMDCITSGALLHLNVYNQDYLPDYVTLVLNSIIVRMQAERDSNGAIIQHWKPSEIEQVVIPYLPIEIQRTIAAKVQQSFALRSECKHLLAEAKLLVESEIQKID